MSIYGIKSLAGLNLFFYIFVKYICVYIDIVQRIKSGPISIIIGIGVKLLFYPMTYVLIDHM